MAETLFSGHHDGKILIFPFFSTSSFFFLDSVAAMLTFEPIILCTSYFVSFAVLPLNTGNIFTMICNGTVFFFFFQFTKRVKSKFKRPDVRNTYSYLNRRIDIVPVVAPYFSTDFFL